MEPHDFWQNVKSRLISKGATQEALAIGIGEKPDTVRQWIKRGTMPDFEQGVRIAQYLQTSPARLLNLDVDSAAKPQPPNINHSFGSRLRTGMERKGISTRTLSALSTVPEDVLEGYIRMTEAPEDVQNIGLISTYLEGGMDWYALRTHEPDSGDSLYRTILYSLNSEDRDAFFRWANAVIKSYTQAVTLHLDPSVASTKD